MEEDIDMFDYGGTLGGLRDGEPDLGGKVLPEHDRSNSSTSSFSSTISANNSMRRPTSLNQFAECQPELQITSPNLVQLLKDEMTAYYRGQGSHRNDVGVIRTNIPLHPAGYVGYFEVEVLDAGERGCVSIGLSHSESSANKHAGSDSRSWSWLGAEARRLHDSRRDPYAAGVKIKSKDVMGCGYHFEKGVIFFTLNGRSLGVAFQDAKGDLFPTVGLHSPGECVRLNFGGRPFDFDICAYIEEEKRSNMQRIRALPLSNQDTDWIIQSYLLHCGYAETFETLCGSQPPPGQGQLLEMLEIRKAIRRLILTGDIAAAQALTHLHFPSVLDPGGGSRNVRLRLFCECQQFVELVRKGAQEDELISTMQTNLGTFYRGDVEGCHLDDELHKMLQAVVSLIAYDNPSAAPQQELLDERQREVVADMLNDAIIASMSNPPPSLNLDLLLRQLVLVRSRLRVFQDGVDSRSIGKGHYSPRRGTEGGEELRPSSAYSRAGLELADITAEVVA
ncbi:uncharacterized protein SPPG_07553 [Spizellomyces punctatus DAOM BR117]|uniref:B30.2/SPRY domain-containing protein n=1 Tax=Spizellomyces punctatus (strain DAOM BR117) TaxID=645134 RepID=A0A0L0H932_SPIPD|nr:uncharacterized protein SPPG_07553 [Spizellomyces punctatus DAOM BR117]KNC97163.1 hypothetical protein SPPG_07553 [Spizellomyces punctatus DAOM BR117]|eukprot:XP_016605203.1 hypothetical protein SPPG_07553 [Spizellomyces punctatus DAOM BR117]